jgi:hypothetical protein
VSPLSAASAPITVSGGAGGAIFADGFSSGTFAAWTQVSNLTIDAGSGSPAPSARAQVSGGKAFASRTLPATYAQVCLSADANLQSGSGTALLRLRTAAGGNILKVAVTAAGKLQLRSDVSTASINSQVSLGSGWHAIEVCGTVGTASRWDLYRDGVRIVTQWQSSTGTTPVGRVMIGDTAAKTVTVNYDDVRLDQAPGG